MSDKIKEGAREGLSRDKNLFLVVTLLVIVFGFFLVRPMLTGYTVLTEERNFTHTLGLRVNTNSEYTWELEQKGSLKSASINARLAGNGTARVYLRHNDTDYLIFDSSRLEEEGLAGLTGYTVLNESSGNETLTNQTEINKSLVINQSATNLSINRSIKLSLEYHNETGYDIDNDGVEEIDGVVDLTVKNTEFNFNAGNDHLCTKWTVNDAEVCYGSNDCCAFIGLESSSDNWDAPYHSYFEKDDASYDNIVSAQVLYFFFNLSSILFSLSKRYFIYS